MVYFLKSSHTKTLYKMVFRASLLGALHKSDSVENKLTSLLTVSLGKALTRDAAIFTWQTGGGAKQSTRRGGPDQLKTRKQSTISYAVYLHLSANCSARYFKQVSLNRNIITKIYNSWNKTHPQKGLMTWDRMQNSRYCTPTLQLLCYYKRCLNIY